MYKSILVATDGSELAQKGLDAAIVLAKQLDAKLFILTVTALIPSYNIVISAELAADPETFETFRSEIRGEANKLLADACNYAETSGVMATGIHNENQVPAVGIIEAADEYNVDLIVLASHGRHGISKLLLGSQTAEVLSLTARPVLVIK